MLTKKSCLRRSQAFNMATRANNHSLIQHLAHILSPSGARSGVKLDVGGGVSRAVQADRDGFRRPDSDQHALPGYALHLLRRSGGLPIAAADRPTRSVSESHAKALESKIIMNNALDPTVTATSSARLMLLTCFAMSAFAANSLLCRLALKHSLIDAASFSAVRLFSGALVLWLLCRCQRPARPIQGSWIGAGMLFVYAFAFSFAYLRLDTGTGALLLFGAVQVSMLVYGLLKGERMRFSAVAGLLLALGGLVSLLLPGATAPEPISAGVMLLSGLAWGIYSLLGRGRSDPLATTAGNFLRATPMVLIASLPFASQLQWQPMGLFYAFLSGALASGVGYAVWYSAMRGLASFQAATVQLSVPILASLAGIFFLGESLSVRLTLAGVAVLGGIALVLGSKRSTE